MKLSTGLIQFIASLHIFVLLTHATIDHLEVKSAKFVLLDDRKTIQVPNRVALSKSDEHYLEFSLHGATIEHIEPKSGVSWTFKLSDNSYAEFSIVKENENVEWKFNWNGGGPNTNREVCFNYGQKDVYWYNTYQSMTPSWPMDTSRTTTRRQFNYLFDYQFNRTTDEHLFILEHLFFNTNGFALLMDHNQPLFIRFDSKGTKSTPFMCFSVDNSMPYAENNHDPSYKDIKFNLFADKDISTVADYVLHETNYFKKISKSNLPDLSFPSWSITQQVTQSQVIEFAKQIVQHGFGSQTSPHQGEGPSQSTPLENEIILDYWEEHDGDLQFNAELFPDPNTMITDLMKMHFQLGIDIYPISNTKEHTDYFVVNRKGHYSQFVDFTNPTAAMFYKNKMRELLRTIWVTTLLASPYGLKRFSSVHDPDAQKFPGILATKYVETAYVQEGEGTLRFESQVAFKSQHIPMIVKLFNHYHGQTHEQLLNTLIPNALSVSMAGYPFIMSYPIGGYDPNDKPTEELYIRWVQASALLPAMSFSIPPWTYSENVVKITKKFLEMHWYIIGKVVREWKNTRNAYNEPDFTPLIRPMWYDTPNDPETYKISDQFMIGEYLVAPILKEGQRERLVYLPEQPDDISEAEGEGEPEKTTWTDMNTMKEYTGPIKIIIKAEIDQLILFSSASQSGKYPIDHKNKS